MSYKALNYRSIFITGIGTDVGKSYATGWLAKMMNEAGVKTITQKFIQTGNVEYSEDIDVHRRVMSIEMQPCDLDHTTAPVIMSYPASPDLASRIDKIEIDFDKIKNSTGILLKTYDCVLIEGAGGIMVPLKDDYLTIDYLADNNLPAIVVTNGQLGSINHTLLTIDALLNRGVKILGIIYNPFFDKDDLICSDTVEYIKKYIAKKTPETKFEKMPLEIV